MGNRWASFFQRVAQLSKIWKKIDLPFPTDLSLGKHFQYLEKQLHQIKKQQTNKTYIIYFHFLVSSQSLSYRNLALSVFDVFPVW